MACPLVLQCPLVWHKKAPKRWNSWRNKSFTRFWGLGKLQKGIAKQEVLASFSKKWKTKSISWACLLAMVMGTKREGAGAKERQLYRLRAQITVKRRWGKSEFQYSKRKVDYRHADKWTLPRDHKKLRTRILRFFSYFKQEKEIATKLVAKSRVLSQKDENCNK